MKKLIGLFLWGCAATIIAQGCILGLSYLRGNLNKETLVAVIAMLNGIDIQGEKLAKVYLTARDVPVPSHDEILKEIARASDQIDEKEAALNRLKEQLDSLRAQLQVDMDRFEERRVAFYDDLDKLNKGSLDKALGEVQQIIEGLPPDQAKSMILTMKERSQMPDVVRIIQGMTPEKRNKIMREFSGKEEETKLHEILTELRKGEPAASLIDQARNGQGGGAP